MADSLAQQDGMMLTGCCPAAAAMVLLFCLGGGVNGQAQGWSGDGPGYQPYLIQIVAVAHCGHTDCDICCTWEFL